MVSVRKETIVRGRGFGESCRANHTTRSEPAMEEDADTATSAVDKTNSATERIMMAS
jgi:hypothetical protein